MSRIYRVFVSSTTSDLATCRRAVVEALAAREDVEPVTMDHFGARSQSPADACDQELRACDLFVGLYAHRYGSIPKGETRSFIEIEFATATRLGKPRLCFWAGDTFPGPPDPDPEQQRRMENFQQRVADELVLDQFGADEAELAGKVVEALDRFMAGYPFGYSVEEVERRWHEAQQHVARHLEHGGFAHAPEVASPLAGQWGQFIDADAWHERLAKLLQGIGDSANQLPYQVAGPVTTLTAMLAGLIVVGAVDDETTAAEMWTRWRTEKGPELKQKLIGDLARRHEDDPARAALTDAIGGLERLERELQDPSFDRCFLVAGEMGAGKTHFLSSLLAHLGDYSGRARRRSGTGTTRAFVLPLSPAIGHRPLERLILDGICLDNEIWHSLETAMRLVWPRVEGFDRFLTRGASASGPWADDAEDRVPKRPDEEDEPPDPRPRPRNHLVVAIDDLQEWIRLRPGFTRDLERLIRRMTRFRSLFWLITIQRNSLDRILDCEDLWRSYGYRSHTLINAGGWIDLDLLNQSKGLGLAILTAAGARELVPATAEGAVGETLRKQLSSPFLARLALDLRARSEDGCERLDFVKLMLRFENTRLRALRDLPTVRNDSSFAEGSLLLEHGIDAIAGELADALDFHPPLAALTTDLASRSHAEGLAIRDSASAEAVVRCLEQGNLLRINPRRKGVARAPIEEVRILMELFWHFYLAGRLLSRCLPESGKADPELLAAWFSRTPSDAARENVMEFLLLQAELQAEDVAEASCLWWLALEDERIPSTAAWFAGSRASEELQHLLIERAATEPGSDRRNLFALMYFLGEASSRVADVSRRLELLRERFKAIQQHNLASFYLYLVERLFAGLKDNGEVVRSMWHFAGSQDLGLADELARLSVATLFRNAEEDLDALTDQVIEYLVINRNRPKSDYKSRPKPPEWQRIFYWEFVLSYYCDRVVTARNAVDAYDYLEQKAWYRPAELKIHQPLG